MSKIRGGDSVVIKAREDNDGYISGMIHYPSKNFMGNVFNTKVEKVSKYFGIKLEGTVIEAGQFNTYLIEAKGGFHFVFTNDYNEMTKIV